MWGKIAADQAGPALPTRVVRRKRLHQWHPRFGGSWSLKIQDTIAGALGVGRATFYHLVAE